MLSAKQISKQYIKKLFTFISSKKVFNQNFQNKVLVNAFFEPSTRTSLSFEVAMHKIGGKVVSFNQDTSSIKKGESFHDTIKTLCVYGDVLVIRHPDIKKIEEAEKIASIPVINAGNGNSEHPTQALLDLYTIHSHLQNNSINHSLTFHDENVFTNLRILFIGDIVNSRTIHSLVELLCKFENIIINVLPYKGCEPNLELLKRLTTHNSLSGEISKNSLQIESYDVIYSSRFQRERSYEENNPDIIIDKQFMTKVKKTAIIMHALPRNNEIDPEVDEDERCVYFKQMEHGVLVRMGILADLFSSN